MLEIQLPSRHLVSPCLLSFLPFRPEMWMDYHHRPQCVFKHHLTGTQSDLETLRWVSHTPSVTFSALITPREAFSVIKTTVRLECLHSVLSLWDSVGQGVTNDECEVTLATFYSLRGNEIDICFFNKTWSSRMCCIGVTGVAMVKKKKNNYRMFYTCTINIDSADGWWHNQRRTIYNFLKAYTTVHAALLNFLFIKKS